MQICPNCGSENDASDPYCHTCGHILPAALEGVDSSTGEIDDEVYEALEPKRRWGTAYFDHESRLQLIFRDRGQTLLLGVADTLILGRAHDEAGVPQPDIDLSPYDALDQGVSRNHIAITHDQDTIIITDLGSSNGTFLNGQRLIPHEPRILRDDDELRLGRLVIRVSFV